MIYLVFEEAAYYPNGGLEDAVLVTRDEAEVARRIRKFSNRPYEYQRVYRLDEETLVREEADLRTGEWVVS